MRKNQPKNYNSTILSKIYTIKNIYYQKYILSKIKKYF